MEDAVRIVGRRKEREITFHASGEALVEGARFTADLRRLPGAGSQQGEQVVLNVERSRR